MYLLPICAILIGQVRFTSVNAVHVHSHYDEFTKTATITLPRNLKLKNKDIREYINEGAEVTIQLGYKPNLSTRFKGYVSEITPGTPMVIKCEDEMYKVKEKAPITKEWKNTTLEAMFGDLFPEYECQVADVVIGKFSANNDTILQILEKLKEVHKLRTFFVGDTLYSDFAYHLTRDTHKIVFQKNVRTSSVNFKDEKHIKLQIRAIANKVNGRKEIVTVGDAGGDVKTLNFGDISRADLTKYAKAELGYKKFTGLRGTVTLWGVHQTYHSDILDLSNLTYPEYDGNYLIDGVDDHFNQGGYSIINELGPKL